MTVPIKADAETREQYVSNIIRVWDSASYAQRARGENWYPTANQLADMMSEGHTIKGAGVIAALSANKSWGENIKLANRAFDSGKASGHFGDAIRKVERIMSGELPDQVLPMDIKTGHFYRCILDPTDPDAICIDRHAHDIAVGERYGQRSRGLGARGRYALMAHVYREAAQRLGELPQVVQAVTWVVWTEQIKGI
ncbi:DUF7178 family protein [Streptosporangium subroseum]|uniref:DUF7178 family protein n=1 Tax=Streptosporangium subroseum TaxID=106412 RepID=UPI00308AFA24|nr:hypothetical protein OHB15_14010 [Streptosporangium subroseum]